LLDAFTSYGTQLFWPLNDIRYAWNAVSVVDPLFSLPLFIFMVGATLRRSSLLARLAIIWVVIYLTLGMVQRDRAEQAGWRLAHERQHTPTRLVVKPTFANILLWKVIYETKDEYYVDAVRVGTSITSYSGESIAKLDVSREFPWLELNSQQAKDIERFSRFSDDFLAQDPRNKRRIIDVRYSMVPNQIDPLWSIQLSPSANVIEHVSYATHRNNTEEARQRFKDMLLGKVP
jgi:inner membrane protein